MRARLAPGLLALSLALSACSGGGEEEGSPTLEPLETTASPSATAEAVPSAAAAATPEGAAEFGRFFYKAIEQGFRSRDAATVREISADACDICQRYVASIERLADRDERLEGNDITVRDAASPGGAEGTTTVTVIYDNTASKRFDAQGRVIFEEPARQGVIVELVLIREATSWTVQEVRSG
jgi:hypothetical protein